MKVKDGDIIEFVAISWNEPQWDFDHPTVIITPVIQYSPNGLPCEGMIEDLAIHLSCGYDEQNENLEQEFNWRGWKLSTLKKVIRDREKGLKTWKTKLREIIKQKIQFYIGNEGYLEYKILETKKLN